MYLCVSRLCFLLLLLLHRHRASHIVALSWFVVFFFCRRCKMFEKLTEKTNMCSNETQNMRMQNETEANNSTHSIFFMLCINVWCLSTSIGWCRISWLLLHTLVSTIECVKIHKILELNYRKWNNRRKTLINSQTQHSINAAPSMKSASAVDNAENEWEEKNEEEKEKK